jgi:type IV secretion system T-DNA border endonuclease VirD2
LSDDAGLLQEWAAQAADLNTRLRADAARRQAWAYDEEKARSPGGGGGASAKGFGSGSGGRKRPTSAAGAVSKTMSGTGMAGSASSAPGPMRPQSVGSAMASGSAGRGQSSGGTVSRSGYGVRGRDAAQARAATTARSGASGPGSRAQASRTASAMVAKGYAPAVVKVVSYAAGSTRAKATAQYVLREEVQLETHDGRELTDREAVNAEIETWSQRFGKREPTQDVMSVRVGIAGLKDEAEDRGQLRRAVEAGFAGHRHAYRMEAGTDGSLSAHVVVAAAGEGRERFKVTAQRIGEEAEGFDRRVLDAPTEARIKARMEEATGVGQHRMSFSPSGPSHGIEGVRFHLGQLIEGASSGAVGDDGRHIGTAGHVHEAARAWRPHLRSQQARDTLHLVVSARAGTDKQRFRDAVRDFLGDTFADHTFLFGMHTDKEESSGHIHAHAVIAVRSLGGAKIHPGPQDLRRWRETYAEHAQAQGLQIVATTAQDRASSQSYGRRDKAIVDAAEQPRPGRAARDRAYASHPANQEMIANARQRIATARTNPVKVPVGAQALARTAEAARIWSELAQAQPGNPVAAQYAQRTEEAYRLGERARSQQSAQAHTEQHSGAPTMPVTAEKMEADLKLMNEQAATTAARLEGPARERYEHLTANVLQASAVKLDLQRMMEQGQTHIDLETVRGMLPPDRAEAIIASVREREAQEKVQAQEKAQGQEQDGASAQPSGTPAPAGNQDRRATEAERAEANRVAVREEREAEAAERLERAAVEVARADEADTSRSPEAMHQLDADRGLAREAARLAEREREEAEAAEQRARSGSAGGDGRSAPPGKTHDPDEVRRQVLERRRLEREAQSRAAQSRDEQEMD